MKYYLFKDYISNEEALFSTRKEANEFVRKFKRTVETESGFRVEPNEYTIRELELNPDFDNWYNSFQMMYKWEQSDYSHYATGYSVQLSDLSDNLTRHAFQKLPETFFKKGLTNVRKDSIIYL